MPFVLHVPCLDCPLQYGIWVVVGSVITEVGWRPVPVRPSLTTAVRDVSAFSAADLMPRSGCRCTPADFPEKLRPRTWNKAVEKYQECRGISKSRRSSSPTNPATTTPECGLNFKGTPTEAK